MKLILKYFSLLTSLLFLFNNSYSQTQTKAPADGGMDMELYTNILLIILFLLINAIFIPLLRTPETAEEKAAKENKRTSLQLLKDKLSGLKPMEKEKSLLMEGNYDGIQELDNDVPPWFNILFYGTIVIGIIYFMNFHVLKTGALPLQEYSDEVYAAELQREELIRTGAFINENSVVILTDNESIAGGKKLFTVNCVTCHGDGGQGIIGPNLTDVYWIHGGGIKNVFKTIKYGVPEKGMITWMNQLNPKQMQQVASYVLTLQGTNPPGGKAPEGIVYVDSSKLNTDSLKVKSDTTDKKTDPVKFDSVKAKKDSSNKNINVNDSSKVKK